MTLQTTSLNGLARLITDWLSPSHWIAFASLGVGWATAGLPGFAWGLFAVFFAVIIPLTVIKTGIRKGHWVDRHLHVRRQRLIVMLIINTSLALGLGAMAALDAPRPVVAVIAAMLATLLVLLAITATWKISIHTAAAAGALAMLAWTYGPALLPAFALVALVGWSRLRLRAHTIAQVACGGALGTIVASGVFVILA